MRNNRKRKLQFKSGCSKTDKGEEANQSVLKIAQFQTLLKI